MSTDCLALTERSVQGHSALLVQDIRLQSRLGSLKMSVFRDRASFAK